MKKIFLLCILSVLITTGFLWRAFAKPNRFGAFTPIPRAEVAALIEEPQKYLGRTVEIEGVITEQCQTMGCYFFFRSGKQQLRVDLQGVAMNAPRHEGGKARVQGQIVHYSDGYQFYASAVEFE